MTKDEIIEMARQARLMSEYDEASPWVEDHEITQYVEAFAKLVAEKERKECAKVAAEWVRAYPHPSGIIENNILARGQKL